VTKENTREVSVLGLVEASRRLGVCAATLKGYADSGLIPVLRDSARRRLFLSCDIEKFAERRKAEKKCKRI
jgi:predicted site-specific integrase-resolvase